MIGGPGSGQKKMIKDRQAIRDILKHCQKTQKKNYIL